MNPRDMTAGSPLSITPAAPGWTVDVRIEAEGNTIHWLRCPVVAWAVVVADGEPPYPDTVIEPVFLKADKVWVRAEVEAENGPVWIDIKQETA